MATPAKSREAEPAVPSLAPQQAPKHDHRGYFAIGNQYRKGTINLGVAKYPGIESAAQIVFEVMSGGGSKAMVAKRLGVSTKSMERWCHSKEGFREVMEMGETLSQAWHEERAMNGLDDPKFNATLWKFIMASRFRDDYVERREVTLPEVADLIKEIHDRNEKLMSVSQQRD